VYLVGLTGGIGSGKSTAAARFRELGCPVLDADAIAREIVEPGQPALDELVERFGRAILQDDGSLDRPALARIVFADDAARADLDRITHPRVAARIAERLAKIEGDPTRHHPVLAILDHPLLFETGQVNRFDAVVVVVASEETRLQRLLESRELDVEDARRRMAVQVDDETRRRGATHVLDNEGSRQALLEQVDAAHAALVEAARRS
jgi:dephospho-CoA kinase